MTPEEYAARLVQKVANPPLWELAVKCFKAAIQEEREACAELARHVDNTTGDPWKWPQLIEAAILARKGS